MRRRTLLGDSEVDYSKEYLTFTALEAGTFQFSGNGISYSLDSGTTWTLLASNTNTPTVNAGDKIMWKATLTPTSSIGIGTFVSSGNFTVEGNAMSLLYGDNYSNQTSFGSWLNYAFIFLFRNCTRLTSAEYMVLPATKLTRSCYYQMFQGCTNLTTAPSTLPATKLTQSCYYQMFQGCTNLTTAPSTLPATTLVDYCYSGMFSGCSSLTTAPTLPATTLADYCYSGMFSGCSSLTTAPSTLPATKLTQSCYSQMFSSCSSLTTAPTLPATKLTQSCYSQMFSSCSSLTTAPTLPATTLADYCYSYMFFYCSKLNSITCLATNISTSNCTTSWVSGVAANGTFTKAASMSSWTTGVNGIPSGWTTVNYS